MNDGRVLTLGLAVVALAAGALVAACEDTTGPDRNGTLTVTLETTPVAPAGAGLPPSLAAGAGIGPSLVVEGSNGTLIINGIWVIVSGFELEGRMTACDVDPDPDFDDADDGAGAGDDECEAFESPPSLVRIPTDGTDLKVLTATVPFGSYTQLEWDVEDVELDEAGEDEAALESVRGAIDAAFGPGTWPAGASMAVVGSFLPAGASRATAFTTFFDAELEVELDLNPPLTIGRDGASRELAIVLSPGIWFRTGPDTVLDLAALSDRVVELEAEFEDGVLKIERDDG
jgi:hypothetical protein